MSATSDARVAGVRRKVTTEHRVDGVTTLVREHGEPRSEAIVFVHGNPGSGADWSGLLAAAGELGYAIAPDMPSYGRSERPNRFPWTVQGYARHLGALLEELGIRRAHLVLHDFGGLWGLAWAAERPDAVASVALFNIGVMPGYRWHKYARLWRMPVIGELFMASTTRGLFRTLLDRENPQPFPRAISSTACSTTLDAGTKRASAPALYRATPDLGALSEQLGARTRTAQLPALVVWGEKIGTFPSRYAALQSRYFAVTAEQVLPGCGHWPFIDERPHAARSCSSLSFGGSWLPGRDSSARQSKEIPMANRCFLGRDHVRLGSTVFGYHQHIFAVGLAFDSQLPSSTRR